MDSKGSGGVLRLVAMPSDRLQHTAVLTHLDDRLDFNDAGYMPRNNLNRAFWETSYKQNNFPADSAVAAVNWRGTAIYRANDDGDRLSPVINLVREASLRDGGVIFSELRVDGAGWDDQIARGNGKVRRGPRQWLFNEYSSPRRGKWQYQFGVWALKEGIDDWALQLETELSYSISDRLSIDGEINPRWSRDWLIWLDGNRLGSFHRTQWDTALNLNWFPKARHELRAKLQWFAIDAHEGKAYRVNPRGRLVSDGVAEDFSINNFGLQLRYRYEIAPQSELYLVYSRGGYEERDRRDESADLFVDALSLRDADQFLAKLRYRF